MNNYTMCIVLAVETMCTSSLQFQQSNVGK